MYSVPKGFILSFFHPFQGSDEGVNTLVDHYLVDEDEGVVAVLGHVVADGFVLYVAGFGGDGSA